MPPGMQTAALQRHVSWGASLPRGSVLRELADAGVPEGVQPRRRADLAIEALQSQLRQQLQVCVPGGAPVASFVHVHVEGGAPGP